jgi:hypothetical protein
MTAVAERPARLRAQLLTRPCGFGPLLALLVMAVLARLPALISARGVHSDAAIVGLQAMHLLEGEWAWFLWGAGYQASVDAVLVALGFAMTGPSAVTLMAVPLLGHLILLGLAYDVLRRAVGRTCAVIVCLPLVWSPQSINGVALYAPRQWSITAVFLAVWLAVVAFGRPRAWAWLAGSGFAAGFAVYLDLFTLQLIPAVAVFALWCAVSDGPEGETRRRVTALIVGAVAGAMVVVWSRTLPVADAAKAGLTVERLAANAELLISTCLPYLLGVKVLVPDVARTAQQWEPPWPILHLPPVRARRGARTGGGGAAGRGPGLPADRGRRLHRDDRRARTVCAVSMMILQRRCGRSGPAITAL